MSNLLSSSNTHADSRYELLRCISKTQDCFIRGEASEVIFSELLSFLLDLSSSRLVFIAETSLAGSVQETIAPESVFGVSADPAAHATADLFLRFLPLVECAIRGRTPLFETTSDSESLLIFPLLDADQVAGLLLLIGFCNAQASPEPRPWISELSAVSPLLAGVLAGQRLRRSGRSKVTAIRRREKRWL